VQNLNLEQLSGYTEIIEHVINRKGRVFFVDGPRGTGKTFLYRCLIATVHSEGLIVVATAMSGISPSIMPGGRTAHSIFKIPIKISDGSFCKFSKQNDTVDLLHRLALIIWDEVAMTKRQSIETLDRSLQDVMGCELPFGGKVMVFGGDFKQVLPIIPRGNMAQIMDATLLRSYIWKDVQKICLTRNMRAQSDPWFSDYLLKIGNGTEVTFAGDYVRLPKDIVIQYHDEHSIDHLIDCVFPDLNKNASSTQYMCGILCMRNDYVDEINERMIDKYLDKAMVFYNFDSVDFLNSVTPNGLLLHELRIKINCPLILLYNLDPCSGLCNGTCLVVRAVNKHILDVEIFNGTHAGDRVFIPRILLSLFEDLSLPFKFKRKQFPMRLSFTMTINKALGQTLPTVGGYLLEPMFSYGQLDVALSRGVSRGSTWALSKPNKGVNPKGNSTHNLVSTDVLGT
jgi:ATP-dependent DNA helicase PIF1